MSITDVLLKFDNYSNEEKEKIYNFITFNQQIYSNLSWKLKYNLKKYYKLTNDQREIVNKYMNSVLNANKILIGGKTPSRPPVPSRPSRLPLGILFTKMQFIKLNDLLEKIYAEEKKYENKPQMIQLIFLIENRNRIITQINSNTAKYVSEDLVIPLIFMNSIFYINLEISNNTDLLNNNNNLIFLNTLLLGALTTNSLYTKDKKQYFNDLLNSLYNKNKIKTIYDIQNVIEQEKGNPYLIFGIYNILSNYIKDFIKNFY